MLVSKARWKKVGRVISVAHADLLSAVFSNGEIDFPPDTWSEETTQLFDLISEHQNRVVSEVADVLKVGGIDAKV